MKAMFELVRDAGLRLKTALMLAVLALAPAHAADFKILEDTPISFRADFAGIDIDPFSFGGNDFDTIVTGYWTVLVNLRGDAVDEDGNVIIFYEIQLTHTGSLTPKKVAPMLHTFLSDIAGPGEVLIDDQIASAPNGIGQEFMATSVAIEFDHKAGVVNFAGSIAGDADLDGNGQIDSEQLTGKPADEVVKTLNDLKSQGVITGREQGKIIQQTRQPK